MTALTFIAAIEDVSLAEWLVAAGMFLVLVVVGFVVVLAIQRRLDPRRRSTPDLGGDLTTESIEMMRLNGTISDAEYKVMRQIVIGKTMSRTHAAEPAADETPHRNDE